MTRTRLSILLPFWVVLIFTFAGVLTGEARSALAGPEGVEWRLIEAGGDPIVPLDGKKQPTLMLDVVQKKASGFAGCNNFFGGYELDGTSLEFGSIVTTRRACPNQEASLEAVFFQALNDTRGWRIRGNELLFVDNTRLLARFLAMRADEPAVDPGYMSYRLRSFSSGTVTLSDGAYHARVAPDGASEIIVTLTDNWVFGKVQGKEAGAVVLFAALGGTGSFYELALLSRGAEGWVNTDSVLLGDRVNVHAVRIENDHVVLDMTIHGPRDPMCCPTLEVTRRFAVRDGRLVPSDEGYVGGEPQIIGTVWQWVQTLYNNDTRAAPVKPENYTVRFLENGSIEVKADCNRKGGTYSRDGKKLSIQIAHSTMAACEQGSLEDQFVRDLIGGAIYFLKDGNLYLDLKYDTGTMKFSRQKQN